MQNRPARAARQAPARARAQAAQSRRSEARQGRQERRATAREARQNRREATQSRRNNAQQANERRGTARNTRQERREAAQERRQQRREAVGNRGDRRNARQERQERRDATQNRQERRNARQERLERREARQDRRQAREGNQRALVSAQQARQGRFATRFARQQARNNRISYRHHRWAWRHNRWAGFVPWYGPVFWPYAYSDIFAYTFWPAGYAPGYWAYAYDDFFDGVFWGYEGPPVDYAYAPNEPAVQTARKAAPVKYSTAQALCKQPGSGITAWPFDDIVKKVNLDAEQKQLLNDMRDASKDAAKQFAESCPPDSNFASTPPGRLDAMTARLNATLQAVGVVRPSLERFYASLSDEQKERFNEIGPNEAKIAAAAPKNASNETQGAGTDQAAANCGDPKPGLANLPIERIESAVKPDDAQEAKLKELETATNDAVGILQAACPDDVPMTPPGRLEAMEKRLKAMVEAANTVKPSLDSFYSSLDNEQKARFNKLGRQIAANDQ